jgi:trehalose-6-phosphate synthase
MPAEISSIAHLATEAKVQSAAARIRAAVRPATTIFLSTGGNDPADGALQGLQEFAGLLSTRQLDPKRVAYIHLAPTTVFPGTRDNNLREELERLVAQINGDFASPGHCPVHYQRRDVTTAELTALYLAADIMLATPMRDRVTPQAAEYAAAHADGRGQIVLSEFSTNTHQLTHAYLINPHEPGALARALLTAASTSKRTTAMTHMHRQVLGHGVADWADQFLTMLAGQPACAVRPPHRTVTQQAIARLSHTDRFTAEGSTRSAQASDAVNQLTATAPHP